MPQDSIFPNTLKFSDTLSTALHVCKWTVKGNFLDMLCIRKDSTTKGHRDADLWT